MVKEILKLLRYFGLAIRLFCEVSDIYMMVPIFLRHCIPIATFKSTFIIQHSVEDIKVFNCLFLA